MTTTSIQQTFQKQSTAVALVRFIFSRERYLDMAVEHGMFINLESQDLRRSFEAGTYPSNDWKVAAREQATEYATSLSDGLWGALRTSILCVAVILVALFVLGYVRPDLPVSAQKWAGGLAAFVGVWGALVSAHPPMETYKKKALHENLHGLISKGLLVLAALLGTLAALL